MNKSMQTDRASEMGQLLLSKTTVTTARRGAVLIAALVCLLVLTLLCGMLLKLALLNQRQQRMSECRAQATWLAEAGLERAAASIVRSPHYPGEIWQVPDTQLSPSYTGLVLIEVQSKNESGQRLIDVRADYIRDGERLARISKQVQITIGRLTLEQEQ
jgi:Tfp pilus assembly protein PilX